MRQGYGAGCGVAGPDRRFYIGDVPPAHRTGGKAERCFLPRITFGTVIKLLLASLVVGMALAWLELSPRELLSWAQQQLAEIVGNASDYVQWAVSYVLLGAVIVVPIWLLSYFWRAARSKGKE